MRIIIPQTINKITDIDIDRISKEMVNIYHGAEFYDKTGQLLTAPVPGYLSWEYQNMEYEFIPSRGFIYISPCLHNTMQHELYIDPHSYTALPAVLLRQFNINNKWGWRKTVFLDHTQGTSLFTLEQARLESLDESKSSMRISGNYMHNRKTNAHFTWFVQSLPRSVRYERSDLNPYSTPLPQTLPQDFPYVGSDLNLTPRLLMQSLSSIVLDVPKRHNFVDGFHSLGYPVIKTYHKLPNVIILSKLLGIDGHLYQLMGGNYKHKRFGRFRAITNIVEPLDKLPTNTRCDVCRVEVFEQYYVATKKRKTRVVCKFCVHFDPKVSTEMNSYKLYICESPTTRESLLEVIPSDDERSLLKMLNRALQRSEIQCIDYHDVGMRIGDCDVEGLPIGGDGYREILQLPGCIGLPTSTFPTINFKDPPQLQYIFKYCNVWN